MLCTLLQKVSPPGGEWFLNRQGGLPPYTPPPLVLMYASNAHIASQYVEKFRNHQFSKLMHILLEKFNFFPHAGNGSVG